MGRYVCRDAIPLPNLLIPVQATYFDQKFYSTFILQDPAKAAERRQLQPRTVERPILSLPGLGEGSPGSQGSHAAGRDSSEHDIRQEVADRRSLSKSRTNSPHSEQSAERDNSTKDTVESMPRNMVPLPISRSHSPSAREADAEHLRHSEQASDGERAKRLIMLVQQQAQTIR